MPATTQTAQAVRDSIRQGGLTAEAACEQALAAIAAGDGPLHAFHLVDVDRAMKPSAENQSRIELSSG